MVSDERDQQLRMGIEFVVAEDIDDLFHGCAHGCAVGRAFDDYVA